MTNATAVVLALLLAAMLFVPRRYIAAVLIIAACFVPVDQRVVLFGLNLTVLRILIAAAVGRLMLFGEAVSVQWSSFDIIVAAWALCGAAVYSVQWMTSQAVINRSGVLFDLFGLYWLFRQTMRSWADVRQAAAAYAVCAIALVPLVALEWTTGHDPFSVLGQVTTLVRADRYRCTAAFPHAIMLGVFWATIVPLFIVLAKMGRDVKLFWTGIIAAVFIIISTTSSTPLVTLLWVIAVGMAFRWRRYTTTAICVVAILLVALHFIMQAPVWHLLARINVVGGSTGWYRFYLIDQAIRHFGDWAVLGCRNTQVWGWGLGDITNQYILEGVRGGLLTLVLFAVMLFMGGALVLKNSQREADPRKRVLLWAVFTMLMGHCAAFGGVSYFGQINMQWYMLLALIGLLAEWQMAVDKGAALAAKSGLEGQLATT
jgi:hypothetical protein